jgi:glycosyltransferase involved in cell wall biosynthesis
VRLLLTADPEIAVPPIGYGGIERIVDALVREYSRLGHEVGLVAREGSSSPAARFYPWPGDSSRGKGNLLRNMSALRHAVRDFCPDVLHSFSRLAYMLPLLPTKLPKVMSYQRHTGGRQVAWAARLAGRSLAFTGCSEFICRQGRPAGGVWTAVHNFVEPEKFTFVPEVPPDAPLVFLSRLDRIKGAGLAIAVARKAGRQLILAGNRASSGPDFDYWATEIEPHLGHGVEWVGEVDDVAKNKLLGAAAALLVPIQWDEPFGIVFAEALACGTPVISCPRGALPEIVEEGKTGFLINTLEEGVEAVGRIDSISRSACRSSVESKFSCLSATAQYLELYEALRRQLGANKNAESSPHQSNS